MTPPANEFTALLARARQGDRLALDELARNYEPEVRVMARVLLGPALRPFLDSMDLVQSVHRSLLVGLRDDRFDISNPEGLVALALTMVRRKAARHWRHLQRQKRLQGGPAGSGDALEILASLSRPETDPARAAQLNDTLRRLWQDLDGTERRLIELRLEGYSTVEAARALGLDSGILRVQLMRLRQRLLGGGLLHDWL